MTVARKVASYLGDTGIQAQCSTVGSGSPN